MHHILLRLCVSCVAVGLAACSSEGADAKRSEPAIPVVTAKVEQRAVPLTLTALGAVEATATVSVQPQVDGQILRVLVSDGAEVKANQPLIQLDPAPFDTQLRAARATLAGHQAALRTAQSREAHGRTLLAQHYISQDEYDQLKTNLDAAAAQVDQDRANADHAALQLSYATIRAPIAGQIGFIAQKAGNMVRAAAQIPITTLNALDPIEVSFTIPEAQLSAVRAAYANAPPDVEIQTPAKAVGRLTFIDNGADPATGTIRLRARFDNAARVLWPGQFVTVALNLAGDPAAIVVPVAAVSQGPKGPYVYVVSGESKAEQRAVRLARSTATLAIISGVQPGEEVVVDGQSRLKTGARVTRAKRAA